MTTMKASTSILVLLTLCGAAAGCVARDPVVVEASSVRAPPRDPQDQSYLNPGPAPARLGGPSYLQSDTGSPMRDDRFANDLIPRIP